MRNLKKVLALLVSLAMVLGTLTVTAFADDEEVVEVGTFAELKAEFEQEHEPSIKTVRLTASFNNPSTGGATLYVVAGDDITLDLAGYRLYASSFRNFFSISGTLTLIDSVGGGSLENYCNMTSTSTSTTRAVYIGSTGTFNMAGGTIKTNCNNGTYNSKSEKLTLKGNLVYAANGASFNMSGGTITECPPYDVNATNGGMIYLGNGTHTITGGTISNGISNSGGNILLNAGTLTISETDGPVLITGGNAQYGGNIRANANSTLVINGGTFSNGVSGTIYGASPSGANLYTASSSNVTINGGTFTGSTSKNGGYYNYFRGNTTINGGRFDSIVRSDNNVVINGGIFTRAMNIDSGKGYTANGGFYAAQQPGTGVTLGEGKYATGECVDAPVGAPYTVDDSETYTVSYALPDGTPISSETENHGTKIEIADYIPDTGTFVRWYYDAELTQTAPAPGDEVEFSTSTTLYAWVETGTLCDVTVNIDGIEDTTLSGIYVQNATFTLPSAPARAHFAFDGYSLTEGGAVAYQAGDEYTVTDSGAIDFYTIYHEVDTRLASFTSGAVTTYVYTAAEFNEAFSDIASDTDIVLLSDITNNQRPGNVAQTAGNEIVINLDLNGCKYTYTGASRGFWAIRAYTTLNIRDTDGAGELYSDAVYTSTHSFIYSNDNGYTNIYGGKYTGDYSAGSAHDIANSRLVIYGGVFDQDPTIWIIAGTHQVEADTPEEGLYTVTEKAEFDYYASVSEDGGAAVNYTSYVEAITAATAATGDSVVVTLLDDVIDTTHLADFNVADITFDLDGHTLTRTQSTRPFRVDNGETMLIKSTTPGGAFIASGNAYTAGNGGFASVIDGATLTVEGVTINGFKTAKSGSTNRFGGAFFVEAASELNLTDCTIQNCSSASGGGVIYTATNSGAGSPTINVDSCTFTGCSVASSANGGVIYLRGATATITDSTLIGDSDNETADALNGGAIIAERNSGIVTTVNLNGTTTISGFSASAAGGGVCVSGACTLNMASTATIDNCYSSSGGAIVFLAVAEVEPSFGYVNGTITECYSARKNGEETMTQPICSTGFVYLNGVLTTTGETVYQYGNAAKSNTISGEVGADVAVKLNYSFALRDDADIPVLSYMKNGAADTAEGELQADGSYTYEVSGITVFRIADNFAPVLATGGKNITPDKTYSVLDYFQNLHNEEGTTEALDTLLANLITYASLLQQYTETGTAIDLTDDSLAWVGTTKTAEVPVTSAPSAVLVSAADETNKVVSAIVNIAEKAAIGFKINATVGSTIVIKREGTVVTTYEARSDNTFILYVDRMSPVDYDTAYTCEVISSGTTVHKVQYSVNAYCVRKAAGEDESLAALVTAIYSYGTAAAAYIA